MSNIDLTQIVTAQDKAARARATAYAALADIRWHRETGGLTLPDGSRISTTRESQAQIAGVVQSIGAGLVSDQIDWKMASGWQTLSPTQVTAIAATVAGHVKRCFAAERAVCALLDSTAGDLSDIDLVQAFEGAYADLDQMP